MIQDIDSILLVTAVGTEIGNLIGARQQSWPERDGNVIHGRRMQDTPSSSIQMSDVSNLIAQLGTLQRD